MKSRGAFILFCAVLAAGSVPVYYIFRYKAAQDNSNKVIITQEKAVAGLEAQVRQLREALKALEMSGAGNGAVSLKEKMTVLQEKLEESAAQNKELAGKIMVMTGDRGHLRQLRKTLDQAMLKNKKISSELAVLKDKLDFARPLEERLSRVGNALVMINAKQVKEKQIKMQLEALVDELSAINANVAQLFGPKSGFTDSPGILSPPLTVLDGRQDQSEPYALAGQVVPVTWSDTYQTLKSELNRMQEQINGLNKRYQDALETIKMNQSELSSRAEKILSLQEKLAQVEAKLAQMQAKSQDMAKDSAVLREQFVYIQLERERLIAELNEAKGKLNELQGKLSRIGNIFGTAGLPDGGRPAIPASQKINVELLPQGTEGNVTVNK